jgi:hypothetical protein
MKEQPSNEYLEACFKLFTRFLKERGQYKMVMNYLFFPGRKKDEFFEKVKNMYCGVGCYSFGDILHLIPVLGGEEDENNWRFRCGVNYFNTIERISEAFLMYWKQHKHEIRVPYNKNRKDDF